MDHLEKFLEKLHQFTSSNTENDNGESPLSLIQEIKTLCFENAHVEDIRKFFLLLIFI